MRLSSSTLEKQRKKKKKDIINSVNFIGYLKEAKSHLSEKSLAA
jgi:hypothetical protein